MAASDSEEDDYDPQSIVTFQADSTAPDSEEGDCDSWSIVTVYAGSTTSTAYPLSVAHTRCDSAVRDCALTMGCRRSVGAFQGSVLRPVPEENNSYNV